ncbi:MAG: hypothetical protein V4621_01535 [Pseudomonadota bacterium]
MASNKRYLSRIYPILAREGIPDIGSDEIRIYGPPASTGYIQTPKFAAAFRTHTGKPLAVVEMLWADDERTHITGRTGLVIDINSKKPVETNLWFKPGSSELSCVFTQLEWEQSHRRKEIWHAKHHKIMGWTARVIALQDKAEKTVQLVRRFEEVAAAMDLNVAPQVIENRSKIAIHPDSHLAFMGK